jgi:putative peptidoglycan lipid II flippase
MGKIKIGKALKTIGFISIAIMFSKALGFFRDLLFGYIYGQTEITDAYMVAANLPTTFFDLTLGAAVMSTFIPTFNDIFKKDGRDKAFSFASNFFNIISLVSIAVCVLGIILSGFIINIYVPNLSDSARQIATVCLIIMLPCMVFTSLAYCLAGLLQSLGEFKVPAIISLISNLLIIFYLLVLSKYFGIYGMAFAVLFGWGAQVIVQIPSAKKKGYKWQRILDFKDKNIHAAMKMAIPVLIASWGQPICVLINTHFASKLFPGAISALNNANKLYILIVGVLSFAITNYIFPQMARLDFSDAKFGEIVKNATRAIIYIITPIMLIMMFFARPIISLLYEYGNFTADAAGNTADSLAFLSLGMVSLGINEILNKVFYSIKNAKTPMFATAFGIALNFALVLLFTNFGLLNIKTLALSSSLATVLTMVILIVCYSRIAKKK